MNLTDQEKKYSSVLHLTGLLYLFLPIVSLLIPFILWVLKRDESPFINIHGKEAINFQLSILIYQFGITILFIPITIITLGIGAIAILLLIIPVFILALLLIINAAIKANEGAMYSYPFTLKILK